MYDPTYVSLFAGIGGLDLAVESLGYECVGQVEWDAACTRVLERWWPSVPRWGDVTGFGAAAYADQRCVDEGEPLRAGRHESRPRPDLVVGGFPCQPASIAGRRKGTVDDRWLWPEFARVIGELGPRAVLVENVSGLLTVNGGRAFSEVLGTLADLGYDTTWTSLRAADVGACHRRERIFLLAHAERGDDAEGSRSAGWEDGQLAPVGRGLGADAADATHADLDGLRRQAEIRPPSIAGVRAEEAGTEPRGADPRRPAPDAGSRSLTGAGSTTDGLPKPAERSAFSWGPYAPAVQRWERVMMRSAPHPVDEKGRLSPAFVEWMMGFPEGWTEGLSRTQALKALGNAVVPQQGAAALSILLEGGDSRDQPVLEASVPGARQPA